MQVWVYKLIRSSSLVLSVALTTCAKLPTLAETFRSSTAAFDLSLSESTLSLQQLKTTTLTISVTGSGSSVTLSAVGLPSGVTAAFTNSPSTPPYNSTLTLTASSTATTGTVNVSIQGAADSNTVTKTLALTVLFNPATITGLKLWLDSSVGITKDGSNNVSQWDDQSGFNNHATQLTGGLQPVYQASSLNGKPVLVFNGAKRMSISASINTATALPLTFFAVTSGTLSTDNLFDSDSAGAKFAFHPGVCGANTVHLASCQPQLNGLALITTGNYLTVQAYISGNRTIEAWRNGVSIGTLSGTPTAAQASFTSPCLGGVNCSAVPAYFNGNVGEVLIYFAQLTTTQRQNVESYLKTKWGL